MSNNQGKVYSVFFRIGLPIVFLVIYVIYMTTADSPSGWWILLATIVGYYGYYWFKKWARRCPKCNCWDGNIITEKSLVNYKEGPTYNSSETTYQKDFTGKTYQETTYFKKSSSTTTYLLKHQCPFCKHEWESTKIETDHHKTRA